MDLHTLLATHEFFMCLAEKIFSHLHAQNMHIKESDLYNFVYSVVSTNEDLISKWIDLINHGGNGQFITSEIKDSELDEMDCLVVQVQLELFDKLVKRFLKACLNQFGRSLLETMGRKKKLSHRVQIQLPVSVTSTCTRPTQPESDSEGIF